MSKVGNEINHALEQGPLVELAGDEDGRRILSWSLEHLQQRVRRGADVLPSSVHQVGPRSLGAHLDNARVDPRVTKLHGYLLSTPFGFRGRSHVIGLTHRPRIHSVPRLTYTTTAICDGGPHPVGW